MKKISKSLQLGGKKLTLSTGHVARQSTGAVVASYGETVVLATVVATDMKEDWGYFPLSVEYQEKLYAGGRIKGSRWVKREGRPSDDEILTARLIDRSIRPLFLKEYDKKEVQVIITVLSVDLENSPDIVSAIAVSAALSASSIPWKGPVGTVRVGLADDAFVLNPTEKQLDSSPLDLVVSCAQDSVVMIEAGAEQVPEAKVVKAIVFAQKESKKLIGFIDEFTKKVGVKKESVEKKKVDKTLERKVASLVSKEFKSLVKKMTAKKVSQVNYEEIRSTVLDKFPEEEKGEIAKVFESLFKKEIRSMILSGKRLDGRSKDEVRDLSAEVGLLPRTHGSAIFNRGETQALTITTLGTAALEQLIETAEGEETKRYIHHYTMPPFSIGETGRVGWPRRREIGHGALAERALLSVIPAADKFPYTIRVVTEVLSSNGSTSMAATCGSTLSLMDAGVPIVAPVAGIAMGLVKDSEKEYIVLTDIVGVEDGYGDMDLKVAGTKDGVTAVQLDVKALGLNGVIIKEAFKGAKQARMKILGVLDKTISKPRGRVSAHAPKIKVLKIDSGKIGELIGPGGRNIKKIIASSGTQIDVDDDGTVNISAATEEELNRGVEQVEAVTKEPQANELYEGEVKRIQSFGAFVEILPGKEGLVHISDISKDYVKDPSDVLSVGDKVQVRVKEIDDLGRLNLSMVLDPSFDKRKQDSKRQNQRGDKRSLSLRGKQSLSFSNAKGKQSLARGNRGKRRQVDMVGSRKYSRNRKKFSGPHFPTSRFLDESKGKRR
jgi:polyribonucleotide nucleotidyltransferase